MRMLGVLLMLGLPALAGAAPLLASTSDDLLADERNTIAVFREVSPSVVFIINKAVHRDYFSMQPAEVQRGAGSGFIWSREGHIVTNFHVVQGGSAFSVVLADQTQYDARLLGAEPRRDIAVLKIEPKGALKPVELGTIRDLQVGQKVLAIGSPFGLDRTLTTGIVSALGREIVGVGNVTIRDMIQTDAAINPGNSGGPLLDSHGRLIGMNTMIASRSGSSAGIGFAVPVTFVRRIVPQIIKDGRAVTPVLGVKILSDEIARINRIEGVIVQAVDPRLGAAEAGLRGMDRDRRTGEVILGDVIVGIDDKPVKSYDQLYNALDGRSPGDFVTVHFVREGKKKKAQVRLSAM